MAATTDATAFTRPTFTIPRRAEYFTERELSMQIGVARGRWLAAIAKELVDNSLDACENAAIAPRIEVVLTKSKLTIRDNGPGLPRETLIRSLDYDTRTSDKLHFVAPTRGQLGNALKCLYGLVYVLGDKRGVVEIDTREHHYRIEITFDVVRGEPRIQVSETPPFVQSGTLITIPGASSQTRLPDELYKLMMSFALFNPHADFTLRRVEGANPERWKPTVPGWHKWLTNRPTSPHWYDTARLERLIGAHVHMQNGDGAMTVRGFVSQFDGCRRSQVQAEVIEIAGLQGQYLRDMITEKSDTVVGAEKLLTAMQHFAPPVSPKTLGVITRGRFKEELIAQGAVPGTFHYKKVEMVDDGLPYMIEVAFALRKKSGGSWVIVGLNWSPLTSHEPISGSLQGADIGDDDPVFLIVHVVAPRFDLKGHGKAQVTLPDSVDTELYYAIQAVTRQWTAAKTRNRRSSEATRADLEQRAQPKAMKYKEAAFQAMVEAIRIASGDGKYPAGARQIMYAIRPMVLALTGGKIWKKSSYFTQTILSEFLEEHPEVPERFDIVYDDRGHCVEPHTGERRGIGTLSIRSYIGGWKGKIDRDLDVAEALESLIPCPTKGPAHRFKFALFIEKEGFDPLIEAAQIAERYDLMLISTKGFSVVAARMLIAALDKQGVTTLLAHDFDAYGASIAHTICHDTSRFKFEIAPKVIDLGFRLADIEGLEREPLSYKHDPRPKLRTYELGFGKGNRLTEEEIAIMVSGKTGKGAATDDDEDEDETGKKGKRWQGHRVELNALTAPQFIAWLERRLQEVGVKKVVPDKTALEAAWHRRQQLAAVAEAAEKIVAEYKPDKHKPPRDLRKRVTKLLRRNPELPWDLAVAELVK